MFKFELMIEIEGVANHSHFQMLFELTASFKKVSYGCLIRRRIIFIHQACQIHNLNHLINRLEGIFQFRAETGGCCLFKNS